ncbi:MAG: serine/threonine protein kinase [Lachnospiraceae bacterium]|nr:serine/threonine protein kinase [Lachnospiraceae bacterium]
MLKIGDLVDGKYKVLSEIGHGGMSTVYLAINEKANKTWAIKEVRKSFSNSDNFDILRQSLIIETDLLKKLKHPHLPSIIDVIDDDDNFLIVMDYIEGHTLEFILSEKGAQNQEDVVDWALQLCEVLDYLHTQPTPIIYRDMKPSNIMLKSDGSVVLIDFGTAREYKTKNTSDTIALGTKGYAAPEQFGGMGQTDARTDIYCLGTTLYQLLTGHNPSDPPYDIYPITYWRPELSTGLEKIILKCVQKDPKDRYQSAGELIYDLQHYRDFDNAALTKYRRRFAMFVTCVSLSVLCCISGILLKYVADKKQISKYNEIIQMANRTTSSEEAASLYMDAIAFDCENPMAYHNFYELIIEDGIFSLEEEKMLLRLNASTSNYLHTFEQKEPLEYADFCYEIGNAYWFYHVREEVRQSGAVSWFETANRYYIDLSDKEMEYKRGNLYIEIGSFYKKVLAAQIAGTDSGMYGEYWRQLSKLKALNDEQPDREIITLRMYREIVNRCTEYSAYMQEDGISKEEILSMIEQIDTDMDEMEVNATSAVKEEISGIREGIVNAIKMVDSSYAF